jgi:hypothetical protein
MSNLFGLHRGHLIGEPPAYVERESQESQEKQDAPETKVPKSEQKDP